VRPQLRALTEGREPATSTGWGPLRGDERRHGGHPRKAAAIRAMEEIGVDISDQDSKPLNRYLQVLFDYVVTVCNDANEACPFFPGAKSKLHWSFEDPAQAAGSEAARLGVFRKVRDDIGQHVEQELVNE
jgi:protein-tyrosine-phosphatase